MYKDEMPAATACHSSCSIGQRTVCRFKRLERVYAIVTRVYIDNDNASFISGSNSNIGIRPLHRPTPDYLVVPRCIFDAVARAWCFPGLLQFASPHSQRPP